MYFHYGERCYSHRFSIASWTGAGDKWFSTKITLDYDSSVMTQVCYHTLYLLANCWDLQAEHHPHATPLPFNSLYTQISSLIVSVSLGLVSMVRVCGDAR